MRECRRTHGVTDCMLDYGDRSTTAMRLESETCRLLLHLFRRLFPPSATPTINNTRESLKEREEKRERLSTNTSTNKIPKREPVTLNGKRAPMHNTLVGFRL